MLLKFSMLFVFASSMAHAETLLETKMRERSAIIRDSAKVARSLNKSINNPYTPAYFLGVDVSALHTDMNVLSQFPGVDISEKYWSGYYWPNYVGGLGYRYNDPRFPKGKYGKSRRYVQERPSASVPNQYLSPSEKYDTVMGILPEEAGSLTSHQWNLGKAEFERTRKVATWQGICNGWAAAAINFPAPKHPVAVPSARGDIIFEAEDIKALGSLLYATGKFESVFNGFRCFEEEIERDDDRAVKPECFDINPADWHLIVTHRLGMTRMPFIIDYVNSEEVWNKPVVGYSVRYFNVKSRGQISNDFRTVLAPARKVRIFRRNRNPNAVSILGVHMTTKLLFGANEDSRVGQTFKTVEYSYLLELDANNRIIGGEWISEKYPDFAWMPRYLFLPATDGDTQVNGLDATQPNANWRGGALAAILHGAPLGKFVLQLFSQAQ